MAGLELGLALDLREKGIAVDSVQSDKMVRDEVCTQYKWHVTLLCVSRSTLYAGYN